MDHIPYPTVASDRSPTHPPTRAWSPHLSMTCPQSVQFVSWDQMGMRRRRRRLTRNKGTRGRNGEKPRSGSGDAIEAEVGPAVVFLRRVTEQVATSFCLDFGREALLGRRARKSVDAGIGKDTRNEIRLSVRAPETSVNVVLVEARPDARAEILRLGQA